MTTSSIASTSGSDATLLFAFKDAAGEALPVSNPVMLEATGVLSERASISLQDGPGGIAAVFIEGTSPIPPGQYILRVQVELADGNSLASERVTISVR